MVSQLTDDNDEVIYVFAIHSCGLFLVDNEGCTTVLCVAAWATRVALLRVNRLSCIKRLGQ